MKVRLSVFAYEIWVSNYLVFVARLNAVAVLYLEMGTMRNAKLIS